MMGLITDRIGLALLYVVFGPLARVIGLTEIQFGILIAAANITLGIASPYWGRRSQSLGRKPVYIIGLSGYALGFALLGMTIQVGLWGWLGPWPLFFLLLGVRLFYGLFAAGMQPAATAYIADITDQGTRAKGMALIGLAAGIGTVLGPVVGGILAAVDAVLPLYVASMLAVTAALVAVVALREPVRHVATAKGELKLRILDPRIFPYLLGWCLIIFVLTGIQTVTAFYLEDKLGVNGPEEIIRAMSVAFLTMGAVMIFMQAIVLQTFRFSPLTMLRVGFALFAVALLVLVSAGSLAAVHVAYGVMGLAFSMINPGLNAGASLSVGGEAQGAVAGLLAAAPILGMVFGPIAGTVLYGLHTNLPMHLGILITVATGVYFCFVRDPA